jgi:hypothetical protein
MKKTKKVVALGTLVVGLIYAVVAYALPAPGPGQEVYVVYYSTSARTTEVGVRAGSHDQACDSWHVNWGTTTPYSRVFISNCIFNGIEY